MFSYAVRRMGFPYPVMPVEKRRGLVPRHGFCSLKPAREEREGMPAAAAGLYASVYGEPLSEIVSLRQEELEVPTMENPPDPPELADILPKVRQLLLEGKGMEAAALSAETAKSRGYGKLLRFAENDWRNIELPVSAFRKISAVTIALGLEKDGEPEDYLRTLDYETGETRVYWTDRRGSWVRRCFVSEPDHCFVQLLTCPEGAELNLRVRLEAPEDWAQSGVTWAFSSWKEGLSVQVQYPFGGGGHAADLQIVRSGGTAEESPGAVRIQGARSILLITRITAGLSAKEKRSPLFFQENAATEEVYQAFLERHVKVHSPRITRCRLSLGRKQENLSVEEWMEKQNGGAEPLQPQLLETMFDAGRYFLATSTGKYPPMWGQWNINVNLQVCSGNLTSLPEMMEVFFAFVENKLPDFRINARRIFGCRGILADIHPDLNNGLLYHFSRTYPHHYWIACAGWIYNEFWGRYLTTGDETFLRDHVLPGLKEIALFFEDYLSHRDSEGRYLFYPCWSPENEPLEQSPVTVNAVMDIMVCREVLENLLEAQRILNLEDEKTGKYQEMLEHLPALLVDEEGGLKEWAWKEHPERYNHRHVSHHYDVWPGMKVNWEDTPELANAILKSNRRRGQQDDSAHGIMHRLFTAIRLKDRQDTTLHIQQLFRHGFVNCNMSTNHFPDRMEFPDMLGGMPAALAEMAVCSRPGLVEFLPAMPQCLEKGELSGVSLYTFMQLKHLRWDLEEGYAQAELVSLKEQRCRVKLYRPAETWQDGRPLTEKEKAEGVEFSKGRPVCFRFQWK